MNHRLVSPVLSFAAALALTGCRAPSPPPAPPPPGPASGNQCCETCAQIDTGGLVIGHPSTSQAGGSQVGGAWLDCTTGTEYWVKANDAPAPPWTITNMRTTICSNWLDVACKTPGTLTWYRVPKAQAQDKGFICTGVWPKKGKEPSTSHFLDPGGYQVTGGSSAWIVVDDHVEYWVMQALIGADGGTVAARKDIGDLPELFGAACTEGKGPTHYFTPSYEPMGRDWDPCLNHSLVCPGG